MYSCLWYRCQNITPTLHNSYYNHTQYIQLARKQPFEIYLQEKGVNKHLPPKI